MTFVAPSWPAMYHCIQVALQARCRDVQRSTEKDKGGGPHPRDRVRESFSSSITTPSSQDHGRDDGPMVAAWLEADGARCLFPPTPALPTVPSRSDLPFQGAEPEAPPLHPTIGWPSRCSTTTEVRREHCVTCFSAMLGVIGPARKSLGRL